MMRIRSILTLIVSAVLGLGVVSESHAQDGAHEQDEKMKKLVEMAPADGFLKAHAGVENPPELLGGPIQVSITQDGGGVFVALPDERELDPHVFGTPEMPRAFAGTPGINGVPPMARGAEGGEYTEMKKKSPFGDAHVVMGGANLMIEATDITAVDGATTQDQVKFQASWQDDAGNTYAVRCCAMMASHGIEFPTFGGVLTNHLLHGFTRLGTALMPTEYSWFAFWGMGQVLKNGEVMAEPRLVHGMLTEYVRTEGYELAHDEEVTPTRQHFHLMVPPMMPNPEAGKFDHSAVPTGFELPNGMELPFWHVMFESIDVEATRG